MKLFIFALFIFCLSAGAASKTGSEYQYQTPADRLDLRLDVTYHNTKSDAAPENTILGTEPFPDTKVEGFRESLSAEYGLNENVAAGLRLTYTSYKTTFSPASLGPWKSAGLEDLKLFLNIMSDLGPGSLRLGTDVDFALEKAKVKYSGDTNRASGGIALTPYLGYEAAMGPGIVGARISYKFYAGDRKRTSEIFHPPSESTLKGPSLLTSAVFYEAQMDSLTLGAALELQNYGEAKTTSRGVTTTNSGTSQYNALIYAPVAVADVVTFLPSFRYSNSTVFDNTIYDSVSFWEINLGARSTF